MLMTGSIPLKLQYYEISIDNELFSNHPVI